MPASTTSGRTARASPDDDGMWDGDDAGYSGQCDDASMEDDAVEQSPKEAMLAAFRRTLEAQGVTPDKMGDLAEKLAADAAAAMGPRARRQCGDNQQP